MFHTSLFPQLNSAAWEANVIRVFSAQRNSPVNTRHTDLCSSGFRRFGGTGSEGSVLWGLGPLVLRSNVLPRYSLLATPIP